MLMLAGSSLKARELAALFLIFEIWPAGWPGHPVLLPGLARPPRPRQKMPKARGRNTRKTSAKSFGWGALLRPKLLFLRSKTPRIYDVGAVWRGVCTGAGRLRRDTVHWCGLRTHEEWTVLEHEFVQQVLGHGQIIIGEN